MAKLLVIDDDVALSRLLKEHLTGEGHEVTTASMAEEGYQEALKDSPDLILLDVILPDATGFQACGKFRRHQQTRHTPIIMMSSAARFANQQEIARRMGANDYLVKPLNIIEVGDRIEEILSTPVPVMTPAAPALPLIETPADPAPPAAIPAISLDNLFTVMQSAFDAHEPSSRAVAPKPKSKNIFSYILAIAAALSATAWALTH